MTNRVIENKELRISFRQHILQICDFSLPRSKHLLGIGPRQVDLDVGVRVFGLMKEGLEGEGRSLDKALVHLHTPKGVRAWVSSQLGQMGRIQPVEGANAIEALWKTFGDLLAVGRKGRSSVYVAKNGATVMEWTCVAGLRDGKTSAALRRNVDLQKIIVDGRAAIGERNTGEAYAEDCTKYFKATI